LKPPDGATLIVVMAEVERHKETKALTSFDALAVLTNTVLYVVVFE
jgi:hypothetical protein